MSKIINLCKWIDPWLGKLQPVECKNEIRWTPSKKNVF